MQQKRRQSSLTLLVLFLLLIVPTLAGAEVLYYVEGESLTWVLKGIPDPSREADFRSVRIARKAGSGEPLYVQLSMLEDERGNEFPRELVVLKTHYDSAEQSWSWASDSRRLLAATDEYADIEIGVYYHKAVPAGVYSGELYAEGGVSIPLELLVERYTDLVIDPPEIKMEIGSGPGDYKAEDNLHVQVLANHQDWVLSLSSAGLFYLDSDESQDSSIEPLELFLVQEQKKMSTYEVPKITGIDYEWWGTSLEFGIQTKVGWEHKAGKYSGVINVDVELKD